MTTAIERIEGFYAGEHVSDWRTVEQSDIQQFADATGDHNWIHVDPDRARRESPFGGPIAHGLWTISLLPYFLESSFGVRPPGIQMGVNYGFDRVRLMSPVPVGARIRNRCKLLGVESKGGDRYLVKTRNTIELEGADKPAMVADWLFMIFVSDAPPAGGG